MYTGLRLDYRLTLWAPTPTLCPMPAVAELLVMFNIFISVLTEYSYYTVSQKTVQNYFCQNFVKFPPILITFGRKVAKRLELCKVHSFSTSPNLRRHTTALNANVPNCHTMLKVVICYNLHSAINLIST